MHLYLLYQIFYRPNYNMINGKIILFNGFLMSKKMLTLEERNGKLIVSMKGED